MAVHHQPAMEQALIAVQWHQLEQIAQDVGEAMVLRLFKAGEGRTIIEIAGEQYQLTLERIAPTPREGAGDS